MAKKKQPNQPTFELNQQVEISGLGQCVIVGIHDDDEVKLEVFKVKDQYARFKNRYVVPVSDVITPAAQPDIVNKQNSTEVYAQVDYQEVP